MKPITVSVGPLVTANATNIATAQRNYGAGGALALIGTLASPVSTAVCASQAPVAAAFTINGTTAVSGVAYPNGYIYITSSGDDHALTFAVVGVDKNGGTITETITGTNAQSSASTKQYWKIVSITPSGSVAANVTVGSFVKATLDTARSILFTTTADESANIATIVGTNWAGSAITETLTLVNNSTVASVLDYLTVTSVTMKNAAAGNISIGTTTTAASPWVRFDDWAPTSITVQCTLTGTANYTVQTTMDDPNNPQNVAISAMTWLSSLDTNAVGASASKSSYFQYAPRFARVLLNSGTGSVTTTMTQNSNGPT